MVNVGDVVRINRIDVGDDEEFFNMGAIGTVVEWGGDDDLLVHFTEGEFTPNKGGFWSELPNCWFVLRDQVELVDNETRKG